MPLAIGTQKPGQTQEQHYYKGTVIEFKHRRYTCVLADSSLALFAHASIAIPMSLNFVDAFVVDNWDSPDPLIKVISTPDQTKNY